MFLFSGSAHIRRFRPLIFRGLRPLCSGWRVFSNLPPDSLAPWHGQKSVFSGNGHSSVLRYIISYQHLQVGVLQGVNSSCLRVEGRHHDLKVLVRRTYVHTLEVVATFVLEMLKLLLDDDSALLFKKWVLRKPTHKKWWLDFQGIHIIHPTIFG